ncbi:DUF962 domain-containing protein, partial [Vibrio owensii]
MLGHRYFVYYQYLRAKTRTFNSHRLYKCYSDVKGEVMRELSEWLEAYGESHQNPINQKIHKVAVPGIFLSVVG